MTQKKPSVRELREAWEKWKTENQETVLSLRDSGMSGFEIVERTGLQYYYVRQCILESGRTMLKQGTSTTSKVSQQAKTKTNVALTKEVFEDLHFDRKISCAKIRKEYKITHKTLKLLLSEWGLENRSSAEQTKIFTQSQPFRDRMRYLANEGKTGVFFMEKNGKFKDTSIERKFEQWCVENVLYYVKQFQIKKGAHRYDFFLPHFNLIVECDGKYYHSKDEQKEKDCAHNDAATQNGYNIVRISCEEINDGRFEHIVRQRLAEQD